MPKYKLPELSYDYGALEPHVSGKIIELHHGKHHAAYVTGANTTQEKLAEARQKNDFAAIAALERALAFHTSGHVLHSIFWQNMTPKGGGKPAGALGDAITKDFGSFDAFKAQLNQAAATIMGSGWAALAWEPVASQLIVTQIYDHQGNTTSAGIPLLVIDAWEHAFYLQYQNRKTEFFDSLWNIWNWNDVAARFDGAQKVNLALKNAVA